MFNKLLDKLFRKDVTFTLALFASEKMAFNIFDEEHLILKYPLKGLWKPKPLRFQADPFLFVKDDELFLFYEQQYWDDPGCIVMVKSKDLKTWTKPTVVLREPFHLSFPFVFRDGEAIYMIPESQDNNTIRLYRANDDMSSFSFVRVLLKLEKKGGIHFSYNDSHIYKKDGKYYLFTSFQKDWMYYQYLYVTDDLLRGVFERHEKSPICVSNEYGRNAGSLVEYGDKILRVTQDCHFGYGDNISLMDIISLDDNQYEEKVYMRNVFLKNSIFIDGGHQLNIVFFKGRYIYATDYKVNKWTWYELYVSVMTKLGLHKTKG